MRVPVSRKRELEENDGNSKKFKILYKFLDLVNFSASQIHHKWG